MPAFNEFGYVVGEPVPDWTPPPRPPHEQMCGDRCDLLPLNVETHGPDLFEAFADEDWSYLPSGPFDTLTDFIEWAKKTCLGRDPLFFAIVEKGTGKAVGMASYLCIAPEAGSIEVGHIHFGRTIQRTPIGTEAMFLMMRTAFQLGYRRYEWKCNSLNEPSRCAAVRFGFSYEGTFRQHRVVKGRNRDTSWFACIDKEWPHLRKAFETWLSPDNFDDAGKQRSSLSQLTSQAVAAASEGQPESKVTTMAVVDRPQVVRQTDFSAGHGNALQACAASIFGLPIDSVPNFIQLKCGYEQGIAEFVAPLKPRKVSLPADPASKLDEDVGRLCILRGKSPRGEHGHVVVARAKSGGGFDFVCDPHPDDTFLDAESPFGWCMLFD